jgi:LysM repeat protein
MHRIATTLTSLASSALLIQTLSAAEPTLNSLNSRISSIETKLISIEQAVKGGGSSYDYTKAATIEATKGSQISAPKLPDNVPAPVSTQTYVIQDGDTVGKIAEKFKVERKNLLEANRLSEGHPIYIGETLLIPVAATSPAPAPAPATDPAPKGSSGIAAEAEIPAPVKKEAIVIGETKKPVAPAAPKAPVATTVHKVAKGDTLTSLAKKYKTSVESLKSANGLRSDTISLGQNLKIPSVQTADNTTTAPPQKKDSAQSAAFSYDNDLLKNDETYGYYTVANGDNLYALARDFFTTMSELQRVNRLGSSTVIHPGDEIIVPTAKYNAYHKEGDVVKR